MRTPVRGQGSPEPKVEDLPPGQVVTATALIRHFAVHSRQALTEPVHILNHGHVGVTLIATETFKRLSEGKQVHSEPGQTGTQLDILVDMITTHVVLMDEELRVVRINLAARKYLGVSERDVRGVPIEQLLAQPDLTFTLRTLQRVRETGLAEEFEQSFVRRIPLLYRVQILPVPGGIALLADEITDRTSLRIQDARLSAYEKLLDAVPGLARGEFNLRGMVTEISTALAALLSTAEDRITGLRFTALFDSASRSAIGDAVEELLVSGKPFGMEARLLGDADRGPVWVSATPIVSAQGQAGGAFVIGTEH